MIGRWGGDTSGSDEASKISEWVEKHFAPTTIDRSIIYDLTQTPKNS